MTNFKIRCSALGDIMTDPRSKSELFSKTAITTAVEALVGTKYGKQPKDIQTDAIRKGLEVEEDAITWLSKRDRKVYVKHEGKLENPYITGTPDIVDGRIVIDIKSSWDIFTFFASKFEEVNKKYWWQLQGYMALTGATKARLCYVLCDTPPAILDQMERKIMWELGNPATDSVSGPIIKAMRDNHTYDLTAEERVFEHTFDYDNEAIERAYERIAGLRIHLKDI